MEPCDPQVCDHKGGTAAFQAAGPAIPTALAAPCTDGLQICKGRQREGKGGHSFTTL